MRIRSLQVIGSLLLLACMIFAVARFDSADRWIALWLPFVVAGVALTFLGTILQKGKDGGVR